MKTQIDHLVVVAKNLDIGVHWCEATLGITPGPGGEHAQYGTHNRLFKIATPANPLAYFEIIALQPGTKHLAVFSTPAPGGSAVEYTYAAYNADDAPLTVTFSNGVTLTVPPGETAYATEVAGNRMLLPLVGRR